ncbi:MAG: nucleotidyltransferase family protein [Methanobacterium sp.]|jgi:predicted nucleotidyltransferase
MEEKKEVQYEIEDVKRKILPILKHYGVKKAGLFGSIVRGELREDSDIDILVEIEKDISLLDFVEFKLEIEEKLGRKVDLVEYSAIKPLLKNIILREQVAIL